MRAFLFRSLAAVLVLVTLACSENEPKQADMARLEAIAKRVTIIRDDFGVPHIYAKTDADAVFGMLYAQAEDDFPRIERNYVWAIGRLAEIEGESALISDLRARLYMSREEAKSAYASAPAWLKTLCEAWADGINYYLAKNPDVSPKLLTAFEPWMTMYFFEGSIGGDIEQIPLRRMAAFYGKGEEKIAPRTAKAEHQTFETTNLALTQPEAPEERLGGSNGFAIAGQHTQSGKAMLLINPHTSFYFRGEIHVTSEEGLNAYGAVTWGQFFVYQGFNDRNGWMHTSTYVDFIDEFVEDVYDRDGTLYYRYGEEERPVTVGSVTLKYKDGDALKERQFPTYHTHHGPITHAVDGKWTVTRINWDPVNALVQSFTRTKTSNHAEFRDMMGIRTNSSNNTVYADADGTIAYYHGNFVPRRDPRFDYGKPVDGADPRTDWQGKHSVDEVITITNPDNGWIQNSNSTPFTAAAEYSPKREDYPRYMAPDAQNFRGIHSDRVLRGIKDLSLDDLIDVAHDPYLPAFAVHIPDLVKAVYATDESDDVKAAADILGAWDYRASAESEAMTLAHFYGMKVLGFEGLPKGVSRMERQIWFATQSDPADRARLLAEVVDDLKEKFGTFKIAWAQVNRFQRLDGAIRQTFDDSKPSIGVPFASGLWGALASYGVRTTPTNKLYGSYGNSFVAVVEFGDKVKAKSMLVGGQSGDPSSPHFLDQAQRYADKNWKTVAYYREDVEKRAKRTYHPGE